MIYELYHAVSKYTTRLIVGCISAISILGCASDKSTIFCDLDALSDTLTSVEKSEQATLRYLEETKNERMRIEEIYKANQLLVEKYIAEQKKTQKACKRGTGNLAPERLNRITPVTSLTEQQLLDLSKASTAVAVEVKTGKSNSNSIDPPYSPSDAPN